MRRATACIALWLFATAALAGEVVRPDQVEGPFVWGGARRVTHVGQLWFADAPDPAALAKAREAGVSVVVDLRDPSEARFDEKAAAEAAGLRYYNVPVTGSAFDPAAMKRIDALVQEHQQEGVLVHCSSSNRAGGWFAVHLAEQGMSLDDALAVGRRTGITKAGIEERVRDYLARDGK